MRYFYLVVALMVAFVAGAEKAEHNCRQQHKQEAKQELWWPCWAADYPCQEDD